MNVEETQGDTTKRIRKKITMNHAKTNKMDNEYLEKISKQLNIITNLFAHDLIKDKPIMEEIDLLTKAGLRATDIANLVDRTENQVYVTQTQLRKKKSKTAKEIPEEQSQIEKEQNV